MKALHREIMLSATYQRSSRANETNVDDEIYYSRYIVRRLPAEVVLDAVSQVTRVPTRFSGYPEGTRALQLPDTQVNSFFLTVFGRPPRFVHLATHGIMGSRQFPEKASLALTRGADHCFRLPADDAA